MEASGTQSRQPVIETQENVCNYNFLLFTIFAPFITVVHPLYYVHRCNLEWMARSRRAWMGHQDPYRSDLLISASEHQDPCLLIYVVI